MVGNGEPLAKELEDFLEAVRTGSEPTVTGGDGLQALYFAHRIVQNTDSSMPEIDVPSDAEAILEVSLD